MNERTDTERLDWLEKQAAFAVLDGHSEYYPIDWECARDARKRIDKVMDAEWRR